MKVQVLLPLTLVVSVALLGLMKIRKKEHDKEEKRNKFQDIKLKVTHDVLGEYLQEKAEKENLLDKTQSEQGALQEQVNMANVKADKVKGEVDICTGEQKSETDQLAKVETELNSLKAEIQNEENTWKTDQEALKEQLAGRSPVCDYLKQSPTDSKLCETEVKPQEQKPEAPKQEEPKAEAPKQEEHKAEAPKQEQHKAEAPKQEEPNAEAPKQEEHKAEAPKQEQPKAEAPKQEQPKAEAPKKEEPNAEAPKQEEPKAEAPKKEEPNAEAPKQEEPKAEAPKKEESKAEAPKQEEPKAEAPKKEEPNAEAPKQEEPKAEAPKKEEPKGEAPKQ